MTPKKLSLESFEEAGRPNPEADSTTTMFDPQGLESAPVGFSIESGEPIRLLESSIEVVETCGDRRVVLNAIGYFGGDNREDTLSIVVTGQPTFGIVYGFSLSAEDHAQPVKVEASMRAGFGEEMPLLMGWIAFGKFSQEWGEAITAAFELAFDGIAPLTGIVVGEIESGRGECNM